MSSELHTIPTVKGELQFTQFCGPKEHGLMIQLTQGFGTKVSPDTPGFINLTQGEALQVAGLLKQWVADCNKAVRKQARQEETLKPYCTGCQNDVYNHGCGGSHACWHLTIAKLVRLREVPISCIPPWRGPIRLVPSCYCKPGYHYRKPNETH